MAKKKMTYSERLTVEQASDGDLLRASVDDPDAFATFYERHFRVVLGFFFKRTACAETAADLTAETFAKAFLSRRRFRDTGAPARAWLLGIARHELMMTLRRGRVENRARRRLGLQHVPVDDTSLERIEELVDFAPLRDELRVAVQRLSPKLSQALELRVLLELPYAEVAKRLSISEPTARVRVARALSQLSDALEVS